MQLSVKCTGLHFNQLFSCEGKVCNVEQLRVIRTCIELIHRIFFPLFAIGNLIYEQRGLTLTHTGVVSFQFGATVKHVIHVCVMCLEFVDLC